jgi:uncharacterized protein
LATLLYIHGFLSSPLSYKAQQTAGWIAQHRPDVNFVCPQLTPYPSDVEAALSNLVEKLLLSGPVYLIGSSLGGFWATWLVERYNLTAVLINPAVRPQNIFPSSHIDVDLKSYHTDDSYRLSAQHLEEFVQADVPVTRVANYWLLVQTGDTTLDYRHAVEKYAGCKQTIETGGDHYFQGYENHLEEFIHWFEQSQR